MATFSKALKALKNGERVARAGWNGKGMWLAMVPESIISVAGRDYEQTAYVVIKTPADTLSPWNASQQDSMANDWESIE